MRALSVLNDLHRGADLVDRVRAIVEEEAPGGSVEAVISGEAFLSEPGALADALSAAIETETARSMARTSICCRVTGFNSTRGYP